MQPLLSHKRATISDWSTPVSDGEAHARAAGRARYNRERQLDAWVRRIRVMRRLVELNCAPGAKAKIAREFGVHRSTITRDIQQWMGEETAACPTCGTHILWTDWDVLAESGGRLPVADPRSHASQARRAAIKAIRHELPRALADLNVFVDGGDEADEEPTYVSRVVVGDIVKRIAGQLDAV